MVMLVLYPLLIHQHHVPIGEVLQVFMRIQIVLIQDVDQVVDQVLVVDHQEEVVVAVVVAVVVEVEVVVVQLPQLLPQRPPHNSSIFTMAP